VRLRPDGAVADDMFMRGFVPWRFRELFVANGLKIVMTDGQLPIIRGRRLASGPVASVPAARSALRWYRAMSSPG
jgi:hypothetical protein